MHARAFRLLPLSLALFALACGGSKPKPPVDAGVDAGSDDAGTDAGVDAGRPRGDDPPAKYGLVVPFPPDAGITTQFGVSAALALDQYGQPMFAALETDPNGDGVYSDSLVFFTRWNGTDKKYQAPVTLATVGNIALTEPNRQVSLARDDSTGILYVAFVTQEKTVRLAYSSDEGATWSQETASDSSDTHVPANPVVVAANGTASLAYLETDALCTGLGCGKLVFRTRTGLNAYGAVSAMPAPTGYDGAALVPFGMALDSSGTPGIAAVFEQTAGLDAAIAYWKPSGGGGTTVIASSQNTDNNSMPRLRPSVALTFADDTPAVAYTLHTPVANTELWYAKATSNDGGGWGTPSGITPNSAGGTFEDTQWYQSLAIDSAGTLAIGSYYDSTPASQQCSGGPKLSRSSNGTTWTTCRPDVGSTGVFGHAGDYVSVAFHAPGKVTIAFFYPIAGNPNMGQGLVIWRDQ